MHPPPAAGSLPAVSLAVPERGIVRKDRLGGVAAELHYLCERPGEGGEFCVDVCEINLI